MVKVLPFDGRMQNVTWRCSEIATVKVAKGT